MGNVNYVLPNGKTVNIPAEDAARLSAADNGRRETDQEARGEAVGAANADRASGVSQGAATLVEGGLDGLSGGLYGKIAGAISPEYAEDFQNRAQNRSGLRTIGELGALALPTGVLGAGGKAVGEASLVGQTARIGRAVEGVAGKTAGRVVEGGLFGAQGAVAASNVTGDPLSVEGVLEDVGIGGVLNFGMGLLGDKLTKAGANAKAQVAKQEAGRADLATTAEGHAVFSSETNRSAYEHFQGTHADATKAANAEVATAKREAVAYKASIQPDSIRGALKTLKTARQEVQAKLLESTYGKEYKATADTAKRAINASEKEAAAYTTWTGSSKLPKAVRKMRSAIDELDALATKQESNFAKLEGKKARETGGDFSAEVKGAPADDDFAGQVRGAAKKAERFGDRKVYIDSLHENMPEATRGTLEEFKAKLLAANKAGDVELSRADLTGAHSADRIKASHTDAGGAEYHMMVDEPGALDHAAPVGGSAAPKEAASGKATMKERVKVYKDRIATASRKLGKGWDSTKVEGGRWVPGADADLDAAMTELHAIRDDIRREFPTGKAATKLPDDLPRLPSAPKLPRVPDLDGDALEGLKKIQGQSRDLSGAIDKATEHLAAGEHALAAAEIRGAGARARQAGFGDIALPDLPSPPSTPRVLPVVKLPKDLEAFSRMTPGKVDELAAAVDQMDPAVGQSFEKMRESLGLEAGETLGETVRGVHKALGKYPAAVARLEAEAAQKAVKAGDLGFFGKVGKTAKRGLEYAAARGVDVGGMKGAFFRTAAGAATGYALDGVEGAYLGGTMMNGKSSLRAKLSGIVAKVAPKAAHISKLGPVSAYLKASFPTGEKDKESDHRKLANNRITDILRTAQATPDAAYMAVEGILGAAGDSAWKFHNAMAGAMTHLSQMAPKDPGTDVTLSGSNWTPSHAQTLEFAHRIEAVVNPLAAIERSVSGEGHPAAAETLWAVWPATMQEFAQSFMSVPNKLSYEAEARVAELLRLPVGLNEPSVLASLQGLYLPSPEQPQAAPSGSPGRPPAVRTQVAGSSVAGLIA